MDSKLEIRDMKLVGNFLGVLSIISSGADDALKLQLFFLKKVRADLTCP